MGEKALHFDGAEVCKRTIHPCCGNRHYNHIGTLKHLRCIAETRKKSISPPLLVVNKDVPGQMPLVGFTRIEFHQRISDGSEKKSRKNYHLNSKT
jgi:hypothetical protein